jgi:amidohydrolase/hippurate hydrolase
MELLRKATAIEKDILEWRRHIHAHPELGMETGETAAFIEKILGEIGIKDVRRCAGTGVAALVRGGNPGPCVGLRADIDALPVTERSGLPFASTVPGKAHACGHDVHAACLLGAARLLYEARDSFNGAVKLIFQPAEETGSGAKSMIADGVLDNPKMKAIFALHVWPELAAGKVAYIRGPVLAGAQGIHITIHGKQGHAAHPHRCIDPVLIAGHIICALQSVISREISPLATGVLTLGKIAGGTAGNIIPDEVVIDGTIRALSPDMGRHILEAARRIVEGTASAMRGSADLTVEHGLPPLVNNDALFDKMQRVFADTFAPGSVETLPEPSMGGEDFALYLEHVPGAFFRLGVGKASGPNFPLHSPDFVVDESGLPMGSAGLAALALNELKTGEM